MRPEKADKNSCAFIQGRESRIQAWSFAVTDNAPFSNNALPPQNSLAIHRRRIAIVHFGFLGYSYISE
jgi:hypothetical protein